MSGAITSPGRWIQGTGLLALIRGTVATQPAPQYRWRLRFTSTNTQSVPFAKPNEHTFAERCTQWSS